VRGRKKVFPKAKRKKGQEWNRRCKDSKKVSCPKSKKLDVVLLFSRPVKGGTSTTRRNRGISFREKTRNKTGKEQLQDYEASY